jgi:hypothetical protein
VVTASAPAVTQRQFACAPILAPREWAERPSYSLGLMPKLTLIRRNLASSAAAQLQHRNECSR